MQWLCYRLYRENGSLRMPNEEDLQLDSILTALFSVIFSHLSPTERRILMELAQSKEANAASIAQALELDLQETHIYLYALNRLGYTRQIVGCTRIGNIFFETWLEAHANSLSVENAVVADNVVKEVATAAHDLEVGYLEKQLETYRVNLARLELQSANYGLNVPFELQNEIEFHKKKIAEIESRFDVLYEIGAPP